MSREADEFEELRTEYYRVAFEFADCMVYALWYEGEDSSFDDAFIVGKDGLLLTFPSLEACEAYAESHGLKVSPDETVAYSCDCAVIPPHDAAACDTDLALWNVFADVAHSLKVSYIGECEKGGRLSDDVLAVYDKLFLGANLPAFVNDGPEYNPDWTADEAELLANILNEGCDLLCRGIAK